MEESKSYIDKDGDKFWYLPSKGKDYWHRLNGPAFEDADEIKKWWYVDNKRHRLDGPAVEDANGTRSWWVKDMPLPAEEVEEWIEENKIDLKTIEGQMAFKLRWV